MFWCNTILFFFRSKIQRTKGFLKFCVSLLNLLQIITRFAIVNIVAAKFTLHCVCSALKLYLKHLKYLY